MALHEAGLLPPAPRADPLFDFALRPMQPGRHATSRCRWAPVLAIIEDETGAGKTEAAFLLLQRMLCGQGQGAYFALPTMATALRMRCSAAPVISSADCSDAPSLTLA